MGVEAYYRGYRIDSYLSPRQQWRWIHREDEWIKPEAEFNLKEKHVSVEDCKKIIDGWLERKQKQSQKPEQLSLF